MPLEKLNNSLLNEVNNLKKEGRSKHPERSIVAYQPPTEKQGERFFIDGYENSFIRLNSNSYLALSNHKKLIAAADSATHRFGVGPGAVRFIDGTYQEHISLEQSIASFLSKPKAKIFNSAYTSNLAIATSLTTKDTYWIGDELNHNSIIKSMRFANVPRTHRSIFKHNNINHLREILENVPKDIKRVCIIFDGIFSMRGDFAPMKNIIDLAKEFDNNFEEGVISIVDDSHGIAAYGGTGRGTAEHTQSQADIVVGTFGKGFGVNGGFIASSNEVIQLVRQKADTYIYTNPLSVADCAAANAAIQLIDSPEGIEKLSSLSKMSKYFRNEITTLALETIQSPHPIVPIVLRDTTLTHQVVKKLFEKNILVIGLTYPVVPSGSETIRIQINAGLRMNDLDYVLNAIKFAIK